jgi:hypothetical protein
LQRKNAKETSVEYLCLDCGVKGDIDVVTEDNVVKECKISTKAVNEDQIIKLRGIAARLFPGSPVHIALPASEAANPKRWMKKPPNKVQAH